MTKVVIFVGDVGHGFNPTTSDLGSVDLMGVMARTPLEFDEELERWRSVVCAVVVRAITFGGYDAATPVLEELSRLELTAPCLVHATTEDTHDGRQWADVVAETYEHGKFVHRTPVNWPDADLKEFLSGVAV